MANLGGIHTEDPDPLYVPLDDLKPDTQYSLHLFYAERSPSKAALHFELNFKLTDIPPTNMKYYEGALLKEPYSADTEVYLVFDGKLLLIPLEKLKFSFIPYLFTVVSEATIKAIPKA